MKQRKMMAGVAAAVLVLSTGAAAYAAEPQDSKAQLIEAVATTSAQAGQPLDEQNLPDGVEFSEAISMDGMDAIAVDEKDLPDGVTAMLEVNGIGGEDVIAFSTTDLPEGVEFVYAISMDGMEATKIAE